MGRQSSGTWTPTKRRGPIAAEFSSPGPASINLTSTFGGTVSTKQRAPAFTISGRPDIKMTSAGPGPGQYNVSGLSNKGKDDPQAPSMHIKPKDPKQYITPAPCDYTPDKAERTLLDTSPKFSFGIKTESGKPVDCPAPNSYSIPTLMGSCKEGNHHSAPSFTMSARARDAEDKMKVPGPGSYDDAKVDRYKTQKSPAFSMGQRTTVPSDHTLKPGPGAHSPEKFMTDNGPMYTMAARAREEEDKMKVPGPGTYNAGDINKCREQLPSYTMAPRFDLPTDHTKKPAPNAYCPEKCMMDNGPMFTMAARAREEEDKMKVPGPGTYNAGDINKCREQLPSYTMAPKFDLPTDHTKKPAPNAYCPEKYQNDVGPKYSMGMKLQDPEDKMKVPGPGSYQAVDVDNLRIKNPVYSMRPKTEEPVDKSTIPSPNKYNPDDSDTSASKKTPEFSFGIKHSTYLGNLRNQ